MSWLDVHVRKRSMEPMPLRAISQYRSHWRSGYVPLRPKGRKRMEAR